MEICSDGGSREPPKDQTQRQDTVSGRLLAEWTRYFSCYCRNEICSPLGPRVRRWQAQTEVELLRVTKGLAQLPVAFLGLRGKLTP